MSWAVVVSACNSSPLRDSPARYGVMAWPPEPISTAGGRHHPMAAAYTSGGQAVGGQGRR
jgi:hypothetical protein